VPAQEIPANLDAEQALLGSMLLDAGVADSVIARITEDAFYSEPHRMVFKAIQAVRAQGGAVDIVTIMEALRQAGTLELVGGASYISVLGNSVPNVEHWEDHLKIVQEKATFRALKAEALRLQELADAGDIHKALEAIERAQAEAAAMIEGREALRYKPELVCLADIEPEEVHWLWKPYLPSRKMTILGGPQGVGKSFLSLAIATAVSSGKPLPAQDGSMFTPPQGNVVILADEDDWGDTIRPRLDAMGANPSNVYLCKSKLDIRTRKREPISLVDVPELRGIINETQPRLVIVDTVHAFIGGNVDPYKMSSVRPVLANIGELARECDAAFLLIMHLSKGAKDRTLDKLHGSVAFAAVVRSVLMVGRDPKLPGVSAMAHEKINIAAAGRTVRFSLANGVFEWAGLSDATATEIFEPDSVRAEKRTKLEEAVEWLQEQLNDGPVLSKELESEAKAADILPGTLRRAGEALGVVKQKQGGRGGWTWSLPRDTQSVLNI